MGFRPHLHHHHPYRHPRGMWRDSPLACYMRAHLHRRLFVAFAAAILLTGVVAVSLSFAFGRSGPGWRTELSRVERFTAGRFARVWDDDAARDELARATARDLDVDLAIHDRRDGSVRVVGPSGALRELPCTRPVVRSEVRNDNGALLGSVDICATRHRSPGGHGRTAAVFIAVLLTLWWMAGRAARRLTRPLTELVRVVQDLGEGKLSSRARLPPHAEGEVGHLARAVNDMAERIERQVDDQRELLAAVSHEIRSPMARMRFVLETLRGPDGQDASRAKSIDELDREMEGIDALVGDLLASARMDFDALRRAPLNPAECVVRVLERMDLDAGLLDDRSEGATVEADATLLAVALTNLLTNARKHGGRPVALRVERREGTVAFEVDDDGEGFAEGEAEKAFEPFYRGDRAKDEGRPGVGLGLALVRRIAAVHGGKVWASNREGGGARVGFAIPG